MGFLQRLFSRGKSKKQQNGNATDEEGVTPKTRHSLSVINALVDRDRRKAQSSVGHNTDGPLEEDPSFTRLLRTNSANFRVIKEIDYNSLPPLSHPINDVVNTAPVSGDDNNFKAEVHRRRIHAREEFPRANSPLSHLDSSHSCEIPPESTDNHSDTEGQEARRKLIKPKPNSYSKATSSIKLSIAPKETSDRRLSGIFVRPATGQQEATVSTRTTSAQATNSMSSRAFQSISSMTSHSNTSSWRSTRASTRSPISPAIERLRKDPSVASLLNMWEPDGSLKASAFSNTPPGERKREHKSAFSEPNISPPIQQFGTPSPNGLDETFNVPGWTPAHTTHNTPSSTHSSLPPPDSELESYDSTDDNYPSSSLHVEAGSDGDLSFGSDFPPAERNPSPTPSNEDEEFIGSPLPVRRASQVFNFLSQPKSEWQSSPIEEIPPDQHDCADVTATAVDQQEAQTTALALPVDPTRRPRGPRANPSPSPLKRTVPLPSDDEDDRDVGLSPMQRRATQKPPPSRIPRPISRGRSGSDSAQFFATGTNGRKSISPLSAMRRPLPQRTSPTPNVNAEPRPSSGVGWIDPNQPPRSLSRASVASNDDYETRARAVASHERAPSRVSFIEPERSHSRASMINTGAHSFVPARSPTPEFRAAHVRPTSALHSPNLSRASSSVQGRNRAGSGSYQMITGGRSPHSLPRHVQQQHRRAVSASYGSPSAHRPITPLLLGVSTPEDYCRPSSRTGRESPLGNVVGRVLLGREDDSDDSDEDSDGAASVLPYRQYENAEDDGFRRTTDVDMSKLALKGDTIFNSVAAVASHKVPAKAGPENTSPIDIKRTPTSRRSSTPNGIGPSKTPESLSTLELFSLAYPLGSQPPRSTTPLVNVPTGGSSRLKTPNRPSVEEDPSPASSSKLGSYGKEIMAIARSRSVRQPAR